MLAPFADRVELREFRLEARDWRAALGHDVRCFLSSLVIHHLDGPAKRALYADLYRHLAPGGALLIMDLVAPTSELERRYIAQAWNDGETGNLRIATYAATPSRRGTATSFRVTKLADPKTVRVRCDGVDDPRWRVVGEDAIEVECEIGDHRFEIATRGRATDDASESKRRGAVAPAPAGADTQSETRTYVPAATTCASCCGPATEKT